MVEDVSIARLLANEAGELYARNCVPAASMAAFPAGATSFSSLDMEDNQSCHSTYI